MRCKAKRGEKVVRDGRTSYCGCQGDSERAAALKDAALRLSLRNSKGKWGPKSLRPANAAGNA
jgi:hypothetical protein